MSGPRHRDTRRSALWVSTSRETPGGMTSFVETIAATPLWSRWDVRFIATHRPGSVAARLGAFARGVTAFLGALVLHPPAVVHLHMAKGGSFFRKAAFVWLAAVRRVPVVLHMHGGEFRLFYDRMPAPVRVLVRATLRRADLVVALGALWAQRLADIAPGARIVAVPNPVRIVGPARQPAPGEPVHVVFLGKMCAAKGTYVLLDAWSRLVGTGTAAPCRLTLAGNGEVEQVRARVAELGLGETVEVRSWLSPAEVGELLATAQVLTLPSRNEGQPMSILEAMSRGICVVATDVGGIPDLVENATSAVLVPADDTGALADALRRVVDDPVLRTRLGGCGLARATRDFDVEVIWRRLDDLYGELVADVAPRRAGADPSSVTG